MCEELCIEDFENDIDDICELCFWNECDAYIQCEKCGRYFCEECGSYGECICNDCK